MSNSTSILDYLGRGTHAARPVSPPIGAGALAVYYETDTGHTFVWSGSAWVQVDGAAGSTTLAGDSDVAISSPANGQLLTYNSGSGKWTNQAAAGAGGLALPFAFVQNQCANGPTSNTLNFQQTATAGNTLLVVVGCHDGDTLTTPTGYTALFNVSLANYARLAAYIKTAAGTETSVVVAGASSTPSFAVLEIAGTHGLDHSATTSVVPAQVPSWIKPPSITPSAGAMLFTACAYAPNTTGGFDAICGPNWINIGPFITGAGSRHLGLFLYAGSGAGAALQPPIISTPGLFSNTAAIVAATWSIL